MINGVEKSSSLEFMLSTGRYTLLVLLEISLLNTLKKVLKLEEDSLNWKERDRDKNYASRYTSVSERDRDKNYASRYTSVSGSII